VFEIRAMRRIDESTTSLRYGVLSSSPRPAPCQNQVGNGVCRYDLNSIRNKLGAKLIRLYNLDPRNPNQNFLSGSTFRPTTFWRWWSSDR
jgi:hypothetical protein